MREHRRRRCGRSRRGGDAERDHDGSDYRNERDIKASKHEASLPRGVRYGRAAGRSSDSRLPLCRLPKRAAQWRRGGGHLLSQRRDRPGLAPGSLTVGPYRRRIYPMVLRWLAVVAWAAVIFALSSIPSLSTHLGTWDTILRKGAHLTEYAILAVLFARATGS